jgi:hypothetical protein
MKTFGGLVLAVVTLMTAPALAAKAAGDTAIAEGATSLSFGVPTGGNPYASGAAGIWRVVGPNMNVGANVGLAFDTEPDTQWDLLLAPAVRYYTATDGPVLPYFLGQANLHLYDTGGNNDPGLAVIGGIGVEWFVMKQFSIAGHVGLGVDLLRESGADPLRIGTFTSNLSAQIYQ